ncbi:unnamed protein product [Adineta ricciae]|uniref:PX domain-containing protein n=1 Tax=Adineta ricciae TaxID=249248 RepID=A0A815T2H0_ADIRI|nr:unnamed protein product [Adineta ricciae]
MTHDNISVLFRPITEFADLTLQVEFLPYPGNDFKESTNEDLQQSSLNVKNQFTIAHLYDYTDEAFSINILVQVSSDISTSEKIIHKRYSDFHVLHRALVHFVEVEMKKSVSYFHHRHEQVSNTSEVNPCFPTRTDRMVMLNGASIQKRRETFKEYLDRIVEHRKFRHHLATFSFLHPRYISESQKEGYLLKRAHSDYRGPRRLIHLPSALNSSLIHHREYFVIKATYTAYIRPDTNVLRFPILVDHGFTFSLGFHRTGVKNGIEVNYLLVVGGFHQKSC